MLVGDSRAHRISARQTLRGEQYEQRRGPVFRYGKGCDEGSRQRMACCCTGSTLMGQNHMTEDQIKHMRDRFLSWKLPGEFKPDNGISYTPPHGCWSTPASGTNLFDAQQADAMVRHMIEGMPGDNVVALDTVTTLSLSPNKVLTSAMEFGLATVAIVGMDRDGEFYFASSESDCMEVNFLLDAGKDLLMREWWKRQSKNV